MLLEGISCFILTTTWMAMGRGIHLCKRRAQSTEYRAQSTKWRAVVGEQKIEYLIVTFVEKESL